MKLYTIFVAKVTQYVKSSLCMSLRIHCVIFFFFKLVESTLLSEVTISISLQRAAILAKISLIFSNYVYYLIKFYGSSSANGST